LQYIMMLKSWSRRRSLASDRWFAVRLRRLSMPTA
jgi:hypothetical protein